MIGTVFAADVDVLAHFDRAFSADDHQPPVAPSREPIGGEPVDTHISRDVADSALEGTGFEPSVPPGLAQLSRLMP